MGNRSNFVIAVVALDGGGLRQSDGSQSGEQEFSVMHCDLVCLWSRSSRFEIQ